MSQLDYSLAVQAYIDELLTGAAAPSSKSVSDDLQSDVNLSATSRLDGGSAELLSSARQRVFLQQFKQAQAAANTGLPSAGERHRPHWAQERFDCVLFSVSNLKFAIPAKQITDIIDADRVEAQLQRFSNKPFVASRFAQVFAAFKVNQSESDEATASGSQAVAKQPVEKWVVDTAALVMPERYTLAMRGRYKHYLEILDSRWMLAVDSVLEPMSLTPEQVRWRDPSTRREWLVGMAIEHRCAVIDVAAIDRQLLADAVLNGSDQS